MDIKETEDMWVVRMARSLRIPDIKRAAAECAPLIERRIAEAGLEVDGPWLFIAHGLPRDGKTVFDWEICRPVKPPGNYAGEVELHRLEPVMAASRVHRGSLRTLFTQGYAPLIAEIEMSRHVFSGESREIYHDWRGPGAPYHAIEIQFVLSR